MIQNTFDRFFYSFDNLIEYQDLETPAEVLLDPIVFGCLLHPTCFYPPYITPLSALCCYVTCFATIIWGHFSLSTFIVLRFSSLLVWTQKNSHILGTRLFYSFRETFCFCIVIYFLLLLSPFLFCS